ncbi:hemagglutinin repeat-containing protein [Pseudomonas sp. N3-W]|uniref:two-partner secretion domain-containing protein n=1 Tax=Pseudomonas sp. N3-W TaxID=2975049 RepID=UPI00217E0961|nr:hemagglutinin repeat-containing protein [Pseudomonas sp. N3-W]UWF47183.1 hemagglutinin repeat-containing protein [Pseudomonas sp. N3-W]
MDIRHLTFLAGQPAAAVKPCEHFWGMPKRGLAFLLANVMFWQPVWAQADGIVVANPNTSLGQAGNGVPIINIATPNGTGLSHNQFHDYNVGTQGVILNNVAGQTGATQLGGIIVGNPNLTNRVAAQTILNEVVGGNPSQLRGYTEVAGQSARVIVANPYGITCNGCGFINTPRVTLTTGKPVLDGGRVDHYQVDQGSVSIDGAGLNASNVDSFEIITRSAKINAEIQAKNLTIIAGRNDVNAQTLNATARADDGSAKPQLAIDSSSLGGMYAGAIRLMGTEAGVGVKLDGKLIASGGDIQLDANGQLSLAETSAANGAVNVKAAGLNAQGPVYAGTALNVQTQGDLASQQTLAARDSITLNAGGQLSNNGVIEAGVNSDNSRNSSGDISLTAQNLNNNGHSVVASRNLTVNTAQTASNQGGTLSAQQQLQVAAGTLDNQNHGRLLSSGTLNLNADQLLNAQSGLVTSNGQLTAAVGYLNNRAGELSSLSNVNLRVAALDNVAGLVMAGNTLDINASGALNNQGGRLVAPQNLQLKVASLDNSNQGSISSQGTLGIVAKGALDNHQRGNIQSSGAAVINAGTFGNQQGGQLVSSNTLSLTAGQVNNSEGGRIASAMALTASVTGLDQHDRGQLSSNTGLSLDLNNGLLNNQNALITTPGALLLNNLNTVLNQNGEISSHTGFTLAANSLDNTAGKVLSDASLTLLINQTLNNLKGQVASQQLLVNANSLINTTGVLSSQSTLDLNTANLDNSSGGSIAGLGRLGLNNTGALTTQGGRINSGAQLNLTTGTLDNSQRGVIHGAGAVSIATGALQNQGGQLSSDQTLDLSATQVNNGLAGQISSTQALNAHVTGLDQHDGGHLFSATRLSLDMNHGLLNNQGGLINAPGQLLLSNLGLVNNRQGEISSTLGFNLTADSLDNTDGKLLSEQALVVRIAQALDNTRAQIAAAAIDLQAQSLNNQSGSVNAGSGLSLLLAGGLNNQGGKLGARDLTVQVADLDNRHGQMTADTRLSLVARNGINNASGSMTAGQLLSVQGASLDNTQGTLLSSAALTANIAGQLMNQAGLLSSDGLLTLTSAGLDNQLKGRIVSKAGLNLAVTGLLDNRTGSLGTTGALSLNADRVDNRQGGSLNAVQAMDLGVQRLDNQGGTLSGQSDLTLTGTTLDNSNGGQLLANGNLKLTLGQLNNQRNGQLSGQAGVQVNAAQLDNSLGGNLYAKGRLGLTLSQQLLNNQGALKGDGAIVLSSAGVNNDGGTLSSVRGLKLTSLGTVSNLGGSLISGDSLDLSSGQLNNGAGGNISSAGALSASVSGLDQQGGKLFSNSRLSLDLNNGQLNNQGGLISTPGQLLLNNLKGVANQKGEISSDKAFGFTAASLDNSAGKIISQQALMLRVDQVLNTAKGLVSANGLNVQAGSLDNSDGTFGSDGQMTLTVSGAVINRNGALTSAGNSTLKAASLDNTAGRVVGDLGLSIDLSGALINQGATLGSGGDLSLTAASFDNRAAGTLLAADGVLTGHISGAFDNRELGKVRATGGIDLTTGSLDNRGGSVAGKGYLTLHGDSADNRGGLIQADQALTLLVGQLDNRDKGNLIGKAGMGYEGTRLDNTGGLLSAVGPLTLKSREVANAGGRIASQADLTANIDTLTQQGGALVAAGNLSLTGNSLDNRNRGAVGSAKALSINVDQIDNRAGELSSTGADISTGGVKLTSQQLDNSNGGKIISGAGLELTVAQLINQTKGMIHADDAIHLTGSRLDNLGGAIESGSALDIRLDDALLNSNGSIASQAGFNAQVASVDNSNGAMTSLGLLTINSKGALINRGATLYSKSGMTLLSASLDNSHSGNLASLGAVRMTTGAVDNSQNGSMTSSDTLDLNATQVSNGAGGAISSEKTLTASVTGLDQQGGELFSKTALSLDLNHGQLNNQGGYINAPGSLLLKNLNGVANQNGEISSTQAFDLTAQSLDNSHGKLLSDQGSLTLRIAQALNNSVGVITGAAIDSRSDSLDNSNGTMSSRGLLDLGVTQALNNHNGVMIADGSLLLASASLDNRDGSISGKRDIVANVGALDNQNGKLIASTSLDLTGNTLDNRKSGLVAATKALKLSVGQMDNRGGELSSGGGVTLAGQQLDNSDSGQVIAGQDLNLSLDQVQNVNGLLNGKGVLSLDGAVLNNLGGSLYGLQKMRLTLSGDLENGQGLIASEGALDVTATHLGNTGGKFSSADALTLTARGDVHNQGGTLITGNSLTLHSASLDNSHKGSLKSKTSMLVSTGALDNSQAGRLDSDDTLALTAGQVTNRDSGSIGSINALTATVSGLDQQGGKLFSNTRLALDLNHGQLNNQNGLINAPLLQLDNLDGVNNQNGEISSAQAFSLAATSLDNSNGKLLSKQALTLRVNQALNNLKGQIAAAALDVGAGSLNNNEGAISSGSDLTLNVAGVVNNQSGGSINAAQRLSLGSADLNNQGGVLLGGSALTLNAMALNNSAKGLINSQGGMTLTAASLDSGNGGEVSAKGDIDLSVGALSQNGGRLLGDGAVHLDLIGGDLDNRNGTLTAKGPLSISRLRDLSNQNGELFSNQSFNVTARTLDNTGGKLISSNVLGLTGDTLLNQGGLMSGWQGLSVNGASLDNRNTGTLSSRSGNLDVSVSGALLNGSAGALVSNNDLSVSAASLDNVAGVISSGAHQRLSVSGLLNNAQGGSIDSGASLTLQAMALSNGATISAQQALNFTGTTLDNSNGSLAGNGAVNIDLLGVLTNTNGKLVSGGPMVISRSTQINNQGGQLMSQGLLTLLTGGLDNRHRGTVAANDNLTLTSTGAVQNSDDGLIYSQNANLQLQAASLGNAKGALQSLGSMGVTVGGDIDNQSGRIIAQNGDLGLSAANIDNRGGTLASIKGALDAHVVGVLKNGYDLTNNRQGGITQAQRLNLSALGGIDNYGGRISAQGGDAVIETASGNFDNRNGGLYAKGLVKVHGNNFDNSGDNDGQIAGSQIDLSLDGALNNRLGIIESDNTLSVRAASLDNQTGQLRALGTSGKTQFQIGGLFDNRNGTVETANTDLTLNAAGFANIGGKLLHVGTGTFDISMPNVSNAGGTLVTRGGLTLNADTWTNSSVIQAGRLTVNVNNFSQTAGGQLLASSSFVGTGGNWNNDGLLASDGSLSLNLWGTYGGNGRASSLGNLGLSAGQLNLNSGTSIAGGGDTTINVGGQLTNAGRLTSSNNMTLTAGGVSNTGTLATGENLTLRTGVLLNSNGLISSGGDMQLLAASFTNAYAQVYGLGNVLIARDASQNKADLLDNRSGNIESAQNLTISAMTVNNVRDVLDYTAHEKSSVSITERDCNLVPMFGCDFRHGGKQNGYWQIDEVDRLTVSRSSAASGLSSGANILINAQTLNNMSSTIAASGSVTANATNIVNQGVQAQEITTTNFYVSYVKQIFAARQMAKDFNAKNSPTPSATVEADLSAFTGFVEGGRSSGSTKTTNTDGQSYDAVIQAGGNVSLNATNNIENGVRRPYYAYVAAGRNKADTGSGSAYSTPIYVNSQLPPNLAQQQVNPLALPGFSLPTGQNGLFRLSGQGGGNQQATQVNTAPQSWSMSSATVSTAQRQQELPTVQARSVQIADVAQVVASDRKLVQITAPTAASNVTGSAINITAPVDNAGNVQLTGHDHTDAAITQVGAVHVEASTQPTVATGPDLSLPTSLPARQDPVVTVTSPVTAPVVPVAPVVNASISAPVAVPGAVTAVPASTAVASQSVARVQGLPDTSARSNPQKYLIETNPVLTDLKQFMSSDYLLANLGYDPDKSAKRLGDGFYEQKLIQQAVVARTGQRFIDGQTSDEKLFKYLMDNAITSKQQLNLSVGVTLTSEQVAALTHDIVWMENATVNGESVLVPVLYLANANNRLAPTGALIAGNDVSLIAGKDLTNAGTLRATNNLSATAGNDLVNSGLIEAGNRLDLLAGNNIVNKAGGIIAGRDVSMTAQRGDVINERTITTHDSSNGVASERRDFTDSAARIEAAKALSVSAGRDINITGGQVESGTDMQLNAGRDVNIAAAQVSNSTVNDSQHSNSNITQLGARISAGQDLSVVAGRDIAAIASQIDAKRDLSLSATENLNLSSAADEQHSLLKVKKLTAQEDHVSQVMTELSAGSNVKLSAGQSLTAIASRITAGDEAYLVAGDKLDLLAAQDSDYSLYNKTKKSSSGKKTRLDEVASTTSVASVVTSGGDSTLLAGKDMLIKGSEIAADKGNVQLVAGNDVQIVAATESNSARHDSSSSKSSWGGLKSSKVQDQLAETQTKAVGSVISGNTVNVTAKRDATITGSSLVSTEDLTVQAGRDLTINAAENTFSRDEFHKEKNRDLSGILTANKLGLDDITGNQHLSVSGQNHTGKSSQTTLTGSTIGSSEGNVSLTSGRELNVIASDLVSTKNMSLIGSKVTIAAGMETSNQSSTDKSNSLAVGRVVGGSIVDTVNTIRSSVKAANSADDPRLKAVKLAQAAMAFNDLGGMAGGVAGASSDYGNKQGSGGSGSLIKIGTELANTHSKSTSDYTSQTAKQSSLNAGKNLLIVADGGVPGTAGDIHVVGSTLKAADTVLLAKDNITLESAQNTAKWANDSTHNKTAIGASFNLGQQNGFTLDLGASIAKSMGTGSSVTQVNTTLDTGSLSLHSGKDTTLAGAQVRADSIKALIDGNLNITSRQDSEIQKSKQGTAGFGGSICVPPFCYGAPVAVTASLSAGNMNSEYKAVTDQSGLFAGKGGYDLDVGKNTTLQGAVIASEASADKNLLSTDRLLVSDIKNTSEISSKSAGISVSYGSNTGSSLGGSVPLALSDSDHSSTRSAVSDGTIVVRNADGANDLVGLNRDTKNANQKLDKPDEKAMQERIDLIQSTVALSKSVIDTVANSQQQAAAERGKAATTDEEKAAARADYDSWNVGGNKRIMADVAAGFIAASLGGVGGSTAIGIVANTTSNDAFKKVGDFANEQKRNATDTATQAAWAEGGAARVLLHALVGAAMGLSSGSAASGALGAGASAALMPAIGDVLGKSGLTEREQSSFSTLIAAGLGVAAGASGGASGAITGGNSAVGVEMFNRKLHKEQETPLLKKKAEELEATRGKPRSSARWEDLLLMASGAEVDAVDLTRLTKLMKLATGNDPESESFAQDMGVAYDVVAKLAAQKIPLTWSDGSQILANGAPVYAFNSTKGQFNDSTLFDAAGNYGPGAVYQQWRQYGQDQTTQHGNELPSISTSVSEVADAAERLSALAGKGVLSVSIIDDALLSMTGVRSGKVVIDAVLEVMAKRQAAREAAADAVKGVVSTEKTALPAGYREGSSAGAAFNETGGLPDGYRRVINTKTGNTEVLGSDGNLYFETSNGLRPKAGGNLAGLVEAEKGIAGAKGLEIAPGKFDYLFGRVASNSHNAARSNQLALEMKRLGVPDNAAGRQMLTDHLTLSAKTDGNVMNTFSNQYGKFEVRESLFVGPSGKAANFQSTFQVLDDGTRKLSTVIPLH